MGRHLGIDFGAILVDFGSQLGAEIEPKSIKKGIEKTMKKRRAPRWQKSRKKTLRRPGDPGVRGPGIPRTREWVNSFPSWPAPASSQKQYNFLCFRHPFWLFSHPNLHAETDQNRMTIDAKVHSILSSVF